MEKTRATLLNTEAGGHEDSVLATTTDLWSTINPVDDKKTNIFATRFHERTLGKVYDRAAVKQQVTTIPLKKEQPTNDWQKNFSFQQQRFGGW